MNGVAFGSVSVRFPVQNINIVAFDPPRIDGGCSGVDMYMGSFSFVNADQLKTMLRSIAQGAVGFAFKMAVQTICGPCAATIADIQTMMQNLNSMGKHTCALSKLAASTFGNPGGYQEATENKQSMLKASDGTYPDWISNAMNKDPLRALSPSLASGNYVIKALAQSDATSKFGAPGGNVAFGLGGEMSEIIMNMVGTIIVYSKTATQDPLQCQGSEPAGSSCKNEPKPILPNIGFDEILNGANASNGSGSLPYWKCDTLDSEDACQNPTQSTFTFAGVRPFVQDMMYGSSASPQSPASGSIMDTIKTFGLGNLTTPQMQFLNSASSLPLLRIMYMTQHNPTVADGIIPTAIDQVAYELTYKVVNTALSILEAAITASKTSHYPEDLRATIITIREDARVKGYRNPEQLLSSLNQMEQVLQAAQLGMPKVAWQPTKR